VNICVTIRVCYNVGSHFRSLEMQPIGFLWTSLVVSTEEYATIPTNHVIYFLATTQVNAIQPLVNQSQSRGYRKKSSLEKCKQGSLIFSGAKQILWTIRLAPVPSAPVLNLIMQRQRFTIHFASVTRPSDKSAKQQIEWRMSCCPLCGVPTCQHETEIFLSSWTSALLTHLPFASLPLSLFRMKNKR
jgi:hypothetical protein